VALRTCPSCGKEASDTANRCPHCGHNFGAGLSRFAGLLVLAVIIAMVAPQYCGK
jgi:anaerobic ribonucleoside-triphosphate reductase